MYILPLTECATVLIDRSALWRLHVNVYTTPMTTWPKDLLCEDNFTSPCASSKPKTFQRTLANQ